MYLPPYFRVDDLTAIHDAMDSVGLCTLVTSNSTGLIASHLPLILDRAAGSHGTLRGHLSKANAQIQELAAGVQALAIFLGPDAYVSPSWYPSKREHGKVVPTWNYVAIHAYGHLSIHEDPARLLANVTALTHRQESPREDRWRVTDAPESYVQGMLGGIVGLELTIERLEGKWKLSQNRPPSDAHGVIAALERSERQRDREVADAMKALPERDACD